VKRRQSKNNLILLVVAASVLMLLYLVFNFNTELTELIKSLRADRIATPTKIIAGIQTLLLGIIAYIVVRVLNSLVFGMFRLRRGFDAPQLVQNVFSLVAFSVLFLLIFSIEFPDANLGALLTTSAIFGVILGLALQDTLGNFFAGISLQADRPFQVGDVITVGAQRHTGVVEEISWRAIKIRTFQNHVVLINNSTAAKEPIEVCSRDNQNARLVFFNTLYNDSPAKAIHVVREAVREADNVSTGMTPVVRIRNLGDSGVEYECKYWLDDYAKYNDTDALVRQRIWYAFRRAGLNFAFPTRTLIVERQKPGGIRVGDSAVIERLSAVDIFAPLSAQETAMLAHSAVRHVFAPDETVIRAGEEGSSMFVVHSGRVRVQITENGRARAIATLNEGDFFGEMALFTGEPRTANVIALEETEVLEIGHESMKQVFDTNPDLVESLSFIISERRQGLARSPDTSIPETDESAGILTAIKRFFGIS
jgi:small-conductance mechanosensitive channel/CRP-like cAMP-binding protein